MKKTILLMLLFMLPFALAGLGDHYNIVFNSGTVGINTTLITGTNINCNNITGAGYDVCAGDGSGSVSLVDYWNMSKVTLGYNNLTACADTQIIKMSGTDWICAADATGAGASGFTETSPVDGGYVFNISATVHFNGTLLNDSQHESLQTFNETVKAYIANGTLAFMSNFSLYYTSTTVDSLLNTNILNNITSLNETVKHWVYNGSLIFNNSNIDIGTHNATANSGIFKYVDKFEIPEPATPPSGTLRLYVTEQEGFSRYNFKDDLGIVRTLNDDEIIVNNTSGSSIAAHRFVYVTGFSGGIPTVDLAKADNISTMPAICVTIESIANDALGRCMMSGLLENVNTNSYEIGTIYVSADTAGLPTNTVPITPNLTQEMGTILVKSATNGEIQIIARSLTGEETGTINNFIVQKNFLALGDLHSFSGNVNITGDISAPFYIGALNGTWNNSIHYYTMTETNNTINDICYNGSLAFMSNFSLYYTSTTVDSLLNTNILNNITSLNETVKHWVYNGSLAYMNNLSNMLVNDTDSNFRHINVTVNLTITASNIWHNGSGICIGSC